MAEHQRWKCRECDHICTASELLEAPNPFADTTSVTGCPYCKAVESMFVACSTAGCTKDGTCGGPGADGVYRLTCYEHAVWTRAASTKGSTE